MNCTYCNTETNNPKYCSRSCAVKQHNTTNPKRQARDRICKVCKQNYGKDTRYQANRFICDECKAVVSSTKAELRGLGNANFGGRYSMIRSHSRATYKKSGMPMSCKICGYSLHVDVCHIRDVKNFPETTTIAEINDISNLVALCKNHHWEFDNGHLNL